MQKLNETRVERLTVEMFETIKTHLGAQPFHSEKVLEALNALAINAASLIAGTGQDPQAIAFFKVALQQQLDAVVAQDRIVIPSTTKELN